MSYFEHVSKDLRGGRHSWRVLTMLWTISLGVTIVARMLVH